MNNLNQKKMSKKIFLNIGIVLIGLLSQNSLAQEHRYQSKVNNNKYVEVSITMEGTIAHYSFTEIDADASIGERLYNLTDLKTEEAEGKLGKAIKIDVPDEANYWFIPFDGSDPVSCRMISVYYECCGKCGVTGECDWINSLGGCVQCKCHDGTTSGCTVTRTGIGYGGGIFLFATACMGQ